MALGSLADRGTKVIGSYDITYLAKHKQFPAQIPATDPRPQHGCLLTDEHTQAFFDVSGLKMREIKGMLQAPSPAGPGAAAVKSCCGTNAHLFDEEDSPTARRLAARLLEGYLFARYPAILRVEPGHWWHAREQMAGHAVLVIGMRRQGGVQKEPGLREIEELVIHDPGLGPFIKRPIKAVFDAAVAPSKKEDVAKEPSQEPRGKLRMVFVTEEKIKRSALSCIRWLYHRDPYAWASYVGVPTPPDPPDLPGGDYRVALVHTRDILKTFATPRYDEATLCTAKSDGSHVYTTEKKRQKKLRDQLFKDGTEMKDKWYWSVAGYVYGELAVVWLFDAGGRETAGPERMIRL